jgi:hypothetical protein
MQDRALRRSFEDTSRRGAAVTHGARDGACSVRHHLATFRKLEGGAQGRNRTTDTVIFSHVLYQLSYLGGWRHRDAAGAYSRPRRSLSSVSAG